MTFDCLKTDNPQRRETERPDAGDQIIHWGGS